MRTLAISDLHLGTRSRVDVLTRPEALAVLLERLDGVDRLVLLGDVLELRHGPARDALAVAEPVMRAIGDALAPDAQVVLVPGNHDHAIAAGWLERRERAGAPGPLGLEEPVPAEQASWIAERLASWLSPATAEVAYPGLWLRDDVYATHGHYLDAHIAVPTLERLSVGALARMVGAIPDPATAEDYEAVLAPLYALSHATAQRADGRRVAIGSRSTAGVWSALAGKGRADRLRGRALALPFRLAVVAVNRAGLGPVRPEIGVSDLRRAALVAIGEAARRLGLAPAHLVFGHMHRAGPLGRDDPQEWRTPGGTQLHNSGNWVYETLFLGRGEQGSNPYWPGSAIALDDEGPPRLERLLAGMPARVLMPS
ncbi:MAG TPA: metallophosphoesterase [Solirubrobacteraceae bacterium]|nr:metallophosphoesterase [Solirubrobacteraceae bacterium]